MRIKIVKMGINGEGIGYNNRIPVFVPQALLNEEVEVTITKKEKRYMLGKMERVVVKNPNRIMPINKQEYATGGFPYMVCTYEEQLEYKKAYLRESLIKYAQINPKLIQPILASEQAIKYRNQLKLPFAEENGKLVTGLYKANSNYFSEIDISSIHEDKLERVRKKVLKVLNQFDLKAYNYKKKQGYRSLVIRGFMDKYQVCFVTGEDVLSAELITKLNEIEEIDSIWQSVNTEKKTIDLFGKKISLLSGNRYLGFDFMDLKLELSCRSFFQLNTKQAIKLYNTVVNLVPENNKLLVEAYSGIGVMSLLLKDKAEEVIGIEEIKEAVVNANQNARNNKIKNVAFVCADAADKLLYLSKTREIDTLVVDPPRSGLDENMLACIMKSKIKNIVYVSCNPSTLAKNLDILKARYNVKTIVPVDMFPQTAHVESVTLLVKK